MAQQHLRTVLASLEMPSMRHPGLYSHIKDGFLDGAGNITETSIKPTLDWIRDMVHWFVINSGRMKWHNS